jgi:hypothetical protein
MGFHRSIASALQIFVLFAFFSLSFFFFALPFLPELRLQLSDFFLHRVDLCVPVAIVLFVTSFFLFLGFYGFNKGRFLYVTMGTHTVRVEEALIRHSLEECFKTHFPQKMQLLDLEILWGKKLEIGVFLNRGQKIEKEFLATVERHLQLLLRQRFGYIKPFYLILKSK